MKLFAKIATSIPKADANCRHLIRQRFISSGAPSGAYVQPPARKHVDQPTTGTKCTTVLTKGFNRCTSSNHSLHLCSCSFLNCCFGDEAASASKENHTEKATLMSRWMKVGKNMKTGKGGVGNDAADLFFLFVLFWVLGVTWGDMEVSY